MPSGTYRYVRKNTNMPDQGSSFDGLPQAEKVDDYHADTAIFDVDCEEVPTDCPVCNSPTKFQRRASPVSEHFRIVCTRAKCLVGDWGSSHDAAQAAWTRAFTQRQHGLQLTITGPPDDGVIHIARATEYCGGGRSDTGHWDDVTCPECLKSKRRPEKIVHWTHRGSFCSGGNSADDWDKVTCTACLARRPIEKPDTEPELVNHPAHYGGDTLYETIKVLRAWMTAAEYIGWLKGNAIKYMSRVGRKGGEPMLRDVSKAVFYLNRLEEFLIEEETPVV